MRLQVTFATWMAAAIMCLVTGVLPIAMAQSNDSTAVASSTLVASSMVNDETLKPFAMFTNIPEDFARWGEEVISPSNWASIGVIAMATGASLIVDHQVYTSLEQQYWKSSGYRSASKDFVTVGNGFTQIGVAAAFATYGAFAGDLRSLRTASEIVEAALVVGGAVQVMKHISGREFPVAATRRTGRWTFLPNQVKYFSHVPQFGAFPSGHLSSAMATLTVIQENYPNEHWISWVGYPVLGGLAMGLTSTGLHWISDFPLALAVGYSFGKIVAHPFRNAQSNEPGGLHTSVTPMMFPNGVMGMELAMAW